MCTILLLWSKKKKNSVEKNASGRFFIIIIIIIFQVDDENIIRTTPRERKRRATHQPTPIQCNWTSVNFFFYFFRSCEYVSSRSNARAFLKPIVAHVKDNGESKKFIFFFSMLHTAFIAEKKKSIILYRYGFRYSGG